MHPDSSRRRAACPRIELLLEHYEFDYLTMPSGADDATPKAQVLLPCRTGCAFGVDGHTRGAFVDVRARREPASQPVAEPASEPDQRARQRLPTDNATLPKIL
jgi:hypothetical protein